MNRELFVSELKSGEYLFHGNIDNIPLSDVLEEVSVNEKNIKKLFQYSYSIHTKAVYDQGKTGRCWIYSGLRCLEYKIKKEYRIKDICLSRNYVAFYDLLEKANYFAETIYDTIGFSSDSRLLAFLFSQPIQDAGQWAFLGNIIDKYGIVPDYAMPETENDKETSAVIRLLCQLLRGFACDVRKNKTDRLLFENKKHDFLTLIYQLLINCFGKPPENFDYKYELIDGTNISACSVTPEEFKNRFLKKSLNEEYIAVINVPTEEMPNGKGYAVRHLGNVVEGDAVKYLNISLNEFQNLVCQQLLTGEPVWFGCDSRQKVCKEYGILDDHIFFNTNSISKNLYQMSKAERLFFSENILSHAMVIEGFNKEKTVGVNRWLVENSYGETSGHNGFLTMSNSWFQNYVYEIVIQKELIEEKYIDEYTSPYIVFDPWHPLGALAK